MYNNLTNMYMWCNGFKCEYVYYQVNGYCHVVADYNHHGDFGGEELVCGGVAL